MDKTNVVVRWGFVAGTAVLLAFVASRLLGDGRVDSSEPRDSTSPSVRWSVAAESAEPFAHVGAETPVNATLTLNEESWVYAIAFDPTRGVLALFPSTQLISDLAANPLPAGDHTLPGRHLDSELMWHTSDAHGPLSFVLIVSESPIRDLEESMESWRQVGNRAFPTRPLLGTYAPDGGMDIAPPRPELPTEVLRDAHGRQDFHHDGAMSQLGNGRFASVLRVQVDVESTEGVDLRETARKVLQHKLGDLLGPQPPK